MIKYWSPRRARTMDSLLERAGGQRGRWAERRVETIFADNRTRPFWLKSIYLSDRDEDRRGIDVVIETTDLGKIFIQVKSSARNQKIFEAKRRSSHILVLVVRPQEALGITRAKLLELLDEERARIIRRRLHPGF